MANALIEKSETPSPVYEKAPPGFTPEQWATFDRDGYLLIEDAIAPDDVQLYIDATRRIAAEQMARQPGKPFTPWNGIAHLDPLFADLIDHPRHVGFAYDLYGELLKLHNSQAFIRPAGKSETKWHNDGARAVPYAVYAPRLPLQLKVGYWLTDLPRPKMGNLVIYPGSHRSQPFSAYTRSASLPGELPVCVRAGTMMLIHGNLFHTVMDNDSDTTRFNLFYTYCPSWVCEADRLECDATWLRSLTRAQRIIMRSYGHPYDRTKPPASDFPLYLDRDTGMDHDEDADLEVPLAIRKRRVKVEEWLGAAVKR